MDVRKGRVSPAAPVAIKEVTYGDSDWDQKVMKRARAWERDCCEGQYGGSEVDLLLLPRRFCRLSSVSAWAMGMENGIQSVRDLISKLNSKLESCH